MQKRVPVGVSHFGTICRSNVEFIDKTLFIQDFLDVPQAHVLLITRPRRHGKTTLLSMVHHFFASEVYGEQTQGLFDGLLIEKVPGEFVKRYQGQYPVIFISFKDVKSLDFEDATVQLKTIFSYVYYQHYYLMESKVLLPGKKHYFNQVLNKEASLSELKTAIFFLSDCLSQHHQKHVILLIDEYDTPIIEAQSCGYTDEMLNFMRGLFGSSLKDNPYLDRALVTGILRVAKESLFSGVNNLMVFTPFQKQYQQYFGFTKEETKALLEKVKCPVSFEEMTEWYNGYTVGEMEIYNPWSVMNCISYGELSTYWANTSENKLIYDLLKEASSDVRIAFNHLLRGKPVLCIIREAVSLRDLDGETGLWTLLFYSGYLRATHIERKGQQWRCQVSIPNIEVDEFYRDAFELLLSKDHALEWYQTFIEYLLAGNVPAFAERLQQILMTRFTLRELRYDYHEAHYQGFVSGLLASISLKEYDIKQQGEGRDGYYDIAIIPKQEKNKALILFEFKAVKVLENVETTCKQSAIDALQQIDVKGYAEPFVKLGYQRIIKVGIAFSSKYAEVAYDELHA